MLLSLHKFKNMAAHIHKHTCVNYHPTHRQSKHCVTRWDVHDYDAILTYLIGRAIYEQCWQRNVFVAIYRMWSLIPQKKNAQKRKRLIVYPSLLDHTHTHKLGAKSLTGLLIACSRKVCQIEEQLDKSKLISRGSEIRRDLVVRGVTTFCRHGNLFLHHLWFAYFLRIYNTGDDRYSQSLQGWRFPCYR